MSADAVLALGYARDASLPVAISEELLGTITNVNVNLNAAAAAVAAASPNGSLSTTPSPLLLFFLMLDTPEQHHLQQAELSGPLAYLHQLTAMFTKLTPEQTHILGQALILTTSVVAVGWVAFTSYCLLLKKATYSILNKHEAFPGMMFRANSWPHESRAFRADSIEATTANLVRRLETLRDGNTTIIATLDAISSSLAQIPASAARLTTIKEDIEQIERYVSHLPFLLSSVGNVLAHFSPSPRRFANGIKAIKTDYEFTVADDTAPIRQKLTSYASLFVLGVYRFETAAAYMAEHTEAARKLFKEREEEGRLLRDLLTETLLRLERAK